MACLKIVYPLIINGHFRILDWRYLPYIRPIFQAYVREYPHKIWPEIWYVYVPPFLDPGIPIEIIIINIPLRWPFVMGKSPFLSVFLCLILGDCS